MSDESSFKIVRKRSNNFVDCFANGITLSVSPSTYYNMTFWEDVIGINSESASIDDGVMKTEYLEGDTLPHREDKVRITMDHSTLIALRDMINRRLESMEESGDE